MTQLQRLAIAPAQISNHYLTLNTEQQHYLNRVLRLQAGDRFIAMDGMGHWWLAELGQPLSQAHLIEPIAADTELPIPVTLTIALPKGQGMDEVVRQATELGVSCIAPVISDRTVLHPSPQKLDRWRRIAKEAAEQSERQVVPAILEPVSFLEHLSLHADSSPPISYLCVARHQVPLLLEQLSGDRPRFLQHPLIQVATGPEGGWTDAEVEAAIAAHYQPVSLGRRILRAVTAPIAALSLVATVLEAPSPTSPTDPTDNLHSSSA